MPLPQSEFQWVEEELERQHLLNELPNMDVCGSWGFVAEVDVIIPASIHNATDDLPLAPERGKVQADMLTEHMRQMLGETRFHATDKLLLTHLPKSHYVVHFALLKFYLRMGLVVTGIHRIVRFKQAPFFETYISFK